MPSRIFHICRWEDLNNPMNHGDFHHHRAFLGTGGFDSVIAVTAFASFSNGTDKSLRVDNVFMRTREDGLGDPSHEVYCNVTCIGNDPVEAYTISFAQILPDPDLQPDQCFEGSDFVANTTVF
ncbi:MAG: hypothetical protein ACK2UK_11535 [Candidatus Promineifilaceae bacterium]